MNFYRCDSCNQETEAIRRGVYQLIPNGWYVIADGPVGKREIELHVCGKECMDTRVKKVALLQTIPLKDLVVKKIQRLSLPDETVDC